jgi:hypothetical protein
MSEPVTGLNILKASYGTGTVNTDVTDEVSKMVTPDGTLSFTVGAQALGILDPAPGVQKTLQISISINGGKPTLLQHEDGDEVAVNAPTIEEKPEEQYLIIQGPFYFLIAVCAVYFGLSFYYLGAEGLTKPGEKAGLSIVGIFLGLMIFTTVVLHALADPRAGIFGLPFTIIGSLTGTIFLMFALLCYDPNFFNFSYLHKAAKTVEAVAETVKIEEAAEILKSSPENDI